MKYSIVGQQFRGLDPYLPGTLPGTPVTLIREPTNQFDPERLGDEPICAETVTS